MDILEFSRLAYKASDKYLKYLKAKGRGISIINVRRIEETEDGSFKLSVASKAFNIEALELKIDTVDVKHDDYNILEYDEENMFIVLRLSFSLAEIMRGRRADEVHFESDLTFLVKAIRDWYTANHDNIRMPVMSEGSASSYKAEGASAEQSSAIDSCLQNPVSYVWGAPGTGKTKMVLANSIYGYYMQKKSVLLMAPTNNALEQSLRGVIEVLREKGADIRKIIRLGNPTSEFAASYPEVCASHSQEKAFKVFTDKLALLRKRIAEQKMFKAVSSLMQEFQQASHDYEEIKGFYELQYSTFSEKQALYNSLKDDFDDKKAKYDSLNAEHRAMKSKLKQQKRQIMLSESFSKYNEILNNYRYKIKELSDEKASVKRKSASVKNTLIKLKKELKRLEEECEVIKKENSAFKNQLKFIFSSEKKALSEKKLKDAEKAVQACRLSISDAEERCRVLEERLHDIIFQAESEHTLINNSPELIKFSRDIFNRSMSYDELGRAFIEILKPYKDFIYDSKLEAKLKSKAAELKEAKAAFQSAREALSAEADAFSESQKNFSIVKDAMASEQERINKISLEAFGEELEFKALKNAFSEFTRAHEGFKADETLTEQLKAVEAEYDSFRLKIKDLISDKYLIACTVDHASLHYEQLSADLSGKITRLFVDEAAYCPLVKAAIFFSFGVPVSLLGDHMQLPPVCEMDRKDIIDNENLNECFMWDMSAIYFPDILLEESSYESIYTAYLESRAPEFKNTSVSFLTRTFRFGKTLAEILDKYVYKQGFHGSDEFETSVTVLNAPRSPEDGRNENLAEARAIKRYLEENKPDDYAILTPYHNQRKLLERELKLPCGKIMTIHASQGREWDTLIISVADAYNKYFMSSNCSGSNGLRIVNTAISRAKKRLVLVMDYEAWVPCRNELLAEVARKSTEFI